MHDLAFGEKPTFPASQDVTYLRSDTEISRVLAGRFQRLASRSNRPDTGRREGHEIDPVMPASLDKGIFPQPPVASGRRKAQAKGSVGLSEALSFYRGMGVSRQFT